MTGAGRNGVPIKAFPSRRARLKRCQPPSRFTANEQAATKSQTRHAALPMPAATRSASTASSTRRSIAARPSCFRPRPRSKPTIRNSPMDGSARRRSRRSPRRSPSSRAVMPRCSRRQGFRPSPRRSSPFSRRETMCSSPTASTGRRGGSATTVLKRLGIETTYYDPLVGAGIKSAAQAQHQDGLYRVAGLADLRGAGHSGHRRSGACGRRSAGLGQHLGDAALLQALRPWGRRVHPGGDQVHRRPCRRDARRHHRERSRLAEGRTHS